MLYSKIIQGLLCGAKIRSMLSRQFTTSFLLKKAFITEPEYLKYLKPPVPVYECLNIQMKSYDFTVLEHYGKYVHKTALHMDIDVEKAWVTPHQAFKITNLDPLGKKVIAEYQLNKFERNIQVTNLHAYSAPIFLEVIQSALPEGVTVSIHPHLPEHETIRYIPDFELIALKDQLEELIVENDLSRSS